jgi:hypothetical protein
MADLDFEVTQEGPGRGTRRESKYETILVKLQEMAIEHWIKIPVESEDEATTVRRAIYYHCGVREIPVTTRITEDGHDHWVVWLSLKEEEDD